MENSKREKEMKVYLQRKGWPSTLSWGSDSSLKVTHVTSCLNIFFKRDARFCWKMVCDFSSRDASFPRGRPWDQ